MTMRKNYFYPDKNDKVTLTFISKNEPFTGYWMGSEEYILNLLKKHVEDYAKKRADTWFFDAGCGTGRLLPNFAKHFDRILAIDPDCYLLEIARTTATKHGFAEKATFQCTSIENLD